MRAKIVPKIPPTKSPYCPNNSESACCSNTKNECCHPNTNPKMIKHTTVPQQRYFTQQFFFIVINYKYRSVTKIQQKDKLEQGIVLNHSVQVCLLCQSDSDTFISPNGFTIISFFLFDFLDYEGCGIKGSYRLHIGI